MHASHSARVFHVVCIDQQYPADYVNQISFFDMGMRSKPGRTYKFYTGDAVYPFGYGLSYTTFEMSWYV